jgi:hypothetical protein
VAPKYFYLHPFPTTKAPTLFFFEAVPSGPNSGRPI